MLLALQTTTDAGWLAAARSWLATYPALETAAGIVALLVVAWTAGVLARRYLVRLVERLTAKSPIDWDNVVAHHGVFRRLAHLIPLAIVYYGIDLVPNVPPGVYNTIENVALVLMVWTVIRSADGLVNAVGQIYDGLAVAQDRPIRGFLQLFKIFMYVLGGILIVAVAIGESPLVLLGGFGAMTAVLMPVFKDTILSVVASIQIASNDMIRLGDWVEMPKYGADGDVIEIALHTVKIQNWDKTVTTIPTHAFISDWFRNWRFMSESGGRRIRRDLYVDQSTIRFLGEEEVDRFKRFDLLREYIAGKEARLSEVNRPVEAAHEDPVNARRLTNIGTFRAYIYSYLQNHPQVRQDMTLLVRQREPTPDGLPIQIYCFTATTKWAEYEGIQSDIFDHILAIVPEFGLSVFQHPSGQDLREIRIGLETPATQGT
ncbi:MAG: mechanosensitive ion channel family protein [Gemmatimonadetes bacterium]|nr:mechanosensitive ion channel family protein [Gemmatimonadota bacterium]